MTDINIRAESVPGPDFGAYGGTAASVTQYVAVLEIDGVEVFRSPARDEARQARADAEEHLAMLRSRGEVGG